MLALLAQTVLRLDQTLPIIEHFLELSILAFTDVFETLIDFGVLIKIILVVSVEHSGTLS